MRIRIGFDKQLKLINHSLRHTGLFGYPALSNAEGLARAAQGSLKKATELVSLVCSANSDAEISKTVKRVDTISDLLCSVLDPAEFIRNVHPDEEFVQVANSVSNAFHNFLSQLNTHPGLYQALRRVVDHPVIFQQLSRQEKKVATLLLHDFEKSGVHMSLKAREEFIKLNDDIQNLGQQFSNNSAPSVHSVEFNNVNDLQGAPSHIIEILAGRSQNGIISIPTHSEIAPLFLRTLSSEQNRKKIFDAMNAANEQQLYTLEQMLQKRGQLAQLLGKKSFAEMFLEDKMAENPETVSAFLESAARQNRPKANEELEQLKKLKKRDTLGDPISFNAWDRHYYGQLLTTQSQSPKNILFGNMGAFFSVGTVFSGLSKIFQSLYGIKLEMEETAPGEVWHDDVRKLSVVHETEGLIGVIYCDLYERESSSAKKYENAAHFTVRCSRRIDNDEDILQNQDEVSMSNPKFEKNVTDSYGVTKKYQLPIVVLVTSFKRPRSGIPSLLNLHDIETLFHEMGHAMHSMLAQTDFQHISGTRVVMDFVEVPSIMMEYFASSPDILEQIGRHYKTEDPVPRGNLEEILRRHSLLQALESQNQIQMAMLDQIYHSELAVNNSIDTTRILYDLSLNHNPIPTPLSFQWQVQFSHLFSYGASYYSYLWCRRWAAGIYKQHFENVPMDSWRTGGELIRRDLLGVGGGRDPRIGLANVLPSFSLDDRKK